MKSAVSLIVLAVTSLSLMGCDDDPLGPSEIVESGSLSFTYTGGLPNQFAGGAFAVEGAPTLGGSGRAARGEFAVAAPHPLESPTVPVNSKLAVVGYAPGAAGVGTQVVLTLPRLTEPGTVELNANCLSVACGRVLILIGVVPSDPHDGVDASCEITKGTLEVTEIADGRIRGTFSGEGQCVRDVQTDPFHDFEIVTGTFDVDIAETMRTGLEIWS